MTRFLFAVRLMASLLLFGASDAGSADTQVAARAGVMVTPKNFPNHNGEDVADMFRLAAELGSFAVMRVDWNDPGRWEAAQAMVGMAQKRNLGTVLELTAFKADELKGASLSPPKDLSDAVEKKISFTNPAVVEKFSRTVLELSELKPDYLAVATDVNLLQLSEPPEYDAFAALYKKLYPQIKQRSPNTKVYVSFQWDALQGKDTGTIRKLIDAFRPNLDLLTVNSDPRKLFESRGPSGLAGDYFGRLAGYASGREPVFVEITWPSEGKSGDADQVAFIRDLPRLMGPAKPAMLAWTFLHDVKILRIFTARLGLINPEGKPKPAFAAFRDLSNDRPSGSMAAATPTPAAAAAPATATAARPGVARSQVSKASQEPAEFAIFTAKKDGSDVKILISSASKEMSHPRVSPDRSRIVLTRYNKRGKDGKATEEQGYEETEILTLNLDGTGLETIIPPKPGVVAANGGWTPDGKSLIYISTDNPQHVPEIRQIDLATRQVVRVPTPAGLKATDPHWEAGKIVFPTKAEEGKGADALWIMNADGSGARQLTKPARSKSGPGLFGDFDPKISPDGSKVAFMRIDGGEGWKVYVTDIATGEEKLLTPKGPLEWLPTWSSDGKLLLYVHVDRDKPKEIGLYTMTPDGKDRKIIPLPRGYLYGHSTFFPGDGSSDSARIIFNGTPKPGL